MATFEESFKEVRDKNKDFTGETLIDHFGNRWLVIAQTYVDIDGLAMPVLNKDGGTVYIFMEPGNKENK